MVSENFHAPVEFLPNVFHAHIRVVNSLPEYFFHRFGCTIIPQPRPNDLTAQIDAMSSKFWTSKQSFYMRVNNDVVGEAVVNFGSIEELMFGQLNVGIQSVESLTIFEQFRNKRYGTIFLGTLFFFNDIERPLKFRYMADSNSKWLNKFGYTVMSPRGKVWGKIKYRDYYKKVFCKNLPLMAGFDSPSCRMLPFNPS